jgi:hypothetical protein
MASVWRLETGQNNLFEVKRLAADVDDTTTFEEEIGTN